MSSNCGQRSRSFCVACPWSNTHTDQFAESDSWMRSASSFCGACICREYVGIDAAIHDSRFPARAAESCAQMTGNGGHARDTNQWYHIQRHIQMMSDLFCLMLCSLLFEYTRFSSVDTDIFCAVVTDVVRYSERLVFLDRIHRQFAHLSHKSSVCAAWHHLTRNLNVDSRNYHGAKGSINDFRCHHSLVESMTTPWTSTKLPIHTNRSAKNLFGVLLTDKRTEIQIVYVELRVISMILTSKRS